MRVGGISASLDLYVKRILEVAINVLRKKRGRPATGQDPILGIRLPVGLRNDVDEWAKRQNDRPSRSEAIKPAAPRHRRSPKGRARWTLRLLEYKVVEASERGIGVKRSPGAAIPPYRFQLLQQAYLIFG